MLAIQRLGGYLAPRSVPQTTPVGPEAAAATIDVERLRGVATTHSLSVGNVIRDHRPANGGKASLTNLTGTGALTAGDSSREPVNMPHRSAAISDGWDLILLAARRRSVSVDRVQDTHRWHSREILLAASKKRKRRIPSNGFRDGRANRHGQIAVLLDAPILVPPRDCPA